MWCDKKKDVAECFDVCADKWLLKLPKTKQKQIISMAGVIPSKIQMDWEGGSRDNEEEKVSRMIFYRLICFVASTLWLPAYM